MKENTRVLAIDFETANASRASACSVGIAIIENGSIIDRFASLIKPPTMDFAPLNMRIHGITPQMVESAPTFLDLYPKLHALSKGCRLIGYSCFDKQVLSRLAEHYDLEFHPTSLDNYTDVCQLAKRTLPELSNHKLKTVAKHLGLPPFNHHDASDDAYACAVVYLHLQNVAERGNNQNSPIAQYPSAAELEESYKGFVSTILEDGIVDYKEAIELFHFLSVLPKSKTVCRLQDLLTMAMYDNHIDEQESQEIATALIEAERNLLE